MQNYPLTEIRLSRHIKLSQLLVFDRVIESGSILHAANYMGLTQPAVTKIIQELEASVDGTLFSRSNRGMLPTVLGVFMARRVKGLLAEFRFMTEELAQFRYGTAGRVIVGTMIAASAHLLPAAIAKLKQHAPNVIITVREGPTAQLFPALATGEVDIVVGRLPEQELPISAAFPLAHQALFEDLLGVVVGASNEIVGHSVTSLHELEQHPWILPTQESPLRYSVECMFRDAGVELPRDLVESMSVLTNLGLLMTTNRIAVMPSVAARPFVQAGLLRTLSIPELGAFGTVGFSVRANRDLTPACESFIKCLQEVSGETGYFAL